MQLPPCGSGVPAPGTIPSRCCPRLRRGDGRDPQAAASALEGVEGVVHLAAEVSVGRSMYEIERYVSTNDVGTAVLLQAMIERPAQRIVVAPSMSVYGEGRCRTADGRFDCFADISRARSLLGFASRFVLQDSLGELAEWLAAQKVVDRNADMRRHLEARGLVA
ncbi:NAD-dependent epimerase/dehydratase family protein [Falsiroseomonas tokyonensis]|uniref:NAD-dependent epimerase/dehydratase family protein n=1 Tax=Falsiroseomonas tokyonensis TaxID=430521 RepID=A0ABV7BQ38_9PROT|nr:NAD-dependent epimerase/dehydratase family protein [Falsiroseomonas tokyonensis]